MIYAVTKSSEETQRLAGALAELTQSRDLVLLVGGLGAGKTTFAQGFGQALGVTEPIVSPTFVLLRTYPGTLPMHHVDIYRLDHLQEVIDLGLMETLDEGGVALVEWGDLAAPVLPRDFLEVRIDVDADDDSVRSIRIRAVGTSWSARQRVLSACLSNWVVAEEDSE